MNQLPHRSFAAAFVRIGPVRDVAIEIFRDRDLGRQRAPALRHLDIFLLENHLAAILGDLRRAPFPIDLIERRDFRVAEHALEAKPRIFLLTRPIFCAERRFSGGIQRGRMNAVFELDHGGVGRRFL